MLEINRSPVIFNIRCVFRGWAQPELDDPEPMLFVKLACGMVFLVRVKLQSIGMQRLGKKDETCPPAFAPLGRIDIHPIDVGPRHREKRNTPTVASTDPEAPARPNHFAKDV